MRAQAITQVRLKEAVLAAWMANVEAEPEWEYHLQTELERSIVRENRVARVGWNTVRTVFPAVLGRAFVQWAAWGERLCVDGHSSFFPVAEMRYR